MSIIIVIGGFALLYLFLKIPQWISNKTGKTIKLRGTFTTLATYEPEGKEKRKLEILQYPLLMSIEHEIEYIQTGDKRILDEFKKISAENRNKIKIAIKVYPDEDEDLEISKNYYINILTGNKGKLQYWESKNSQLYFKTRNIDFKSFYTLNIHEKAQIEKFIRLYAKTLPT